MVQAEQCLGTGQLAIVTTEFWLEMQGKIAGFECFVQGMLEDEDDAAIVSTVINLGHWLNLRVVAEGVSKQALYDRLVDLGCDEVQGYLLGKPMPGDELTERLFGPLAGAGLEPVRN